jgi:hypothetical protein
MTVLSVRWCFRAKAFSRALRHKTSVTDANGHYRDVYTDGAGQTVAYVEFIRN